MSPWIVPLSRKQHPGLPKEELPRVYNFFRYRIGDRATSEDLTALAFEKAWRARLR